MRDFRFAKSVIRRADFSATKDFGAGLLKEIQLSSVNRAIMCTALEYEHSYLTPQFFNGGEKPLFARTTS